MGKKNKKKGEIQRPRFHLTKFSPKPEHINPETGKIELEIVFDMINHENKVVLAHNKQVIENDGLQIGYFGENKNRILADIGGKVGDYSYDIGKNLSRFGYLVAIDTNSQEYNGYTVCLGIAFYLIKHRNGDWEIIDFPDFIPLHTQKEKMENINWPKLIEHIQAHAKYSGKQKIGLVVDSDLVNLEAYNSRIKPIIDTFYLPENFELIYASDKAHDTLLNTAIIACHKVSTAMLKELIQSFKMQPHIYEYFLKTYANNPIAS